MLKQKSLELITENKVYHSPRDFTLLSELNFEDGDFLSPSM